MSGESPNRTPGDSGGSRFATTHWSLVLEAGKRHSPEALAVLCRTYWYPLYAFVRRRGHTAHDAEDLTQQFFATLLEKEYLQPARRERGRFRSFLLTAMKRFLSKERDRAAAQKRGGTQPPISLDRQSGESRYSLEPSHDWTAEKIFERRWALTLLEHVLDRVRQDCAATGKAWRFDRLKVFLTGESGGGSYRRAAADLNMTEGAVKVAVHRLRHQYRRTLREEIAQTLADPNEADDELGILLRAIRGEKS